MKRIAFLTYDWDYEIMSCYYQGMRACLQEHPEVRLVVFHTYGLYHQFDLQAGTLELFGLCDLDAFDGFILQGNRMWPPEMRAELVGRIRALGKPVVSINYELPGATCVGTSNYDAMRSLVTEVLTTRRVTRPLLVTGLLTSQEAQDRARGFRDACARLGIGRAPEIEGGWERERGLEIGARLASGPDPLPEAVFCSNDDVASGLQEALQAAGVRVPDDVLVSGFDNRENSQRAVPRITTVDRNYQGTGRLALETVLAQLEGADAPAFVPSEALLVLSRSCGYEDDLHFQQNMAKSYYTMEHELKLFYERLIAFQPAVLSADSLPTVLAECERYLPDFYCDRAYVTLDAEYLKGSPTDPVTSYGPESLLVGVTGTPGLTSDEHHVYERFRSLDLVPASVVPRDQMSFVLPLRHNAECFGTLVVEGLPKSLVYGHLTFLLTLLSSSLDSVRQRAMLRRMNQRLDDLYVHDQLTGLFNRFGLDRYGAERYETLLKEAGEAWLVFVDIDNMKRVNDVFGHELGDEAIRDAGRVIARACSGSDDFAMRYGGDEFLLVSHADPMPALEDALARLKAEAERPYDLRLSIGAYLVTADDRYELADAVARADVAMYESKRRRKREGGEGPTEARG